MLILLEDTHWAENKNPAEAGLGNRLREGRGNKNSTSMSVEKLKTL
jgi:hypothetical protein